MTVGTAVRRPSVAARRVGYAIAVVLNAVLWYLVNVRPGWATVPFLTPETEQVLPLVNASLIVGLVVNLVYLGYDPRWWKSVGDLCTSAVSLAVLVRVLQVFPFSFTGWSGWPVLTRVVLVVGLVGTAIGMVGTLVSLARRPE
ncbi:MAG TPA: hypothetical protein VFH03_08875 [Actinoplanes sp.]|nr:hypothetical protein [Actinoplanes sp.]